MSDHYANCVEASVLAVKGKRSVEPNICKKASGSGIVGRAVTSETRDMRFKSSYHQFYLMPNLLKRCNYRERGRQ